MAAARSDVKGDPGMPPSDAGSSTITPFDLGIGLLFEWVREAVVVASLETNRIVLWNPSASTILGFALDDVIGQPVEKVIPDRFRALHRAGWERYRATGDGRYVSSRHPIAVSALRKDGSEVPVELTLSPLAEPRTGERYVLALLRDVSERRREVEARIAALRAEIARDEAERGREQLRQVLDVLPEAVAVVDALGRLVLVNRVASEFAGEIPSSSESPDYPATFSVLRLNGSAFPMDEFPLARSLRTGEVVQGEQLLIRHSGLGREVPALVNSAPLRDTAGAIVGGVVAFQDISGIKNLEEQKDALVAAITHDLKTPLTAIRGNAQLARRRIRQHEAIEPERVVRALDTIDATAVTMTEMIDDLADAARMGSGRIPALERQPTDMVALVLRVAAQYQAISERHGIRVEAEVPHLSGLWDAPRLERALANLVANAIKYSPDGGDVRINVRRAFGPEGSRAVVTVVDRGIGIAPADLPTIFERHRRGRNVAGIVGTGIGLWNALQIVEQHGGQIQVESTEGIGSLFTISLPLS